MNLNEAFMDITNQTIILDSDITAPIDTSSNQNANISLYHLNSLANIDPIQETGDDVFGTIQEPGPASRRRKGGFRKRRPQTRKFQKMRKSYRSKKLKATRVNKSHV